MNRLAGTLASLSWIALATVTLTGALFRSSSMQAANYSMVVIFAAVAAFVAWRTTTFERLLDILPDSTEARAVRRADLTASLAMLALGTVCPAGAALRVWSEGAAVFG